MSVNLTNNVNADINFYIKTSESLIAPSTNTPLLLGTGGEKSYALHQMVSLVSIKKAS